MKDLIDAAAEYLDAGFSIIALTGKAPNGFFHEHGLQEPLTGSVETDEDRALLERIFGHATTSGIGLLIPEHMLVADVDTEAAADMLLELSSGEMPRTATAKTRNGLHLWFLAPGAARSVWVGGKVLLFRGAGSYVAAPPSRHPDGGRYEWLWPLSEGVDWLPDGIATALANQEHVASLKVRTHSSWLWNLHHEDGKWWMEQTAADADITPLARKVAETKEGNRNAMLAWAAMTAAEEGIPQADAEPALTEAALTAGLGERETRVTIRSAYRRRG